MKYRGIGERCAPHGVQTCTGCAATEQCADCSLKSATESKRERIRHFSAQGRGGKLWASCFNNAHNVAFLPFLQTKLEAVLVCWLFYLSFQLFTVLFFVLFFYASQPEWNTQSKPQATVKKEHCNHHHHCHNKKEKSEEDRKQTNMKDYVVRAT